MADLSSTSYNSFDNSKLQVNRLRNIYNWSVEKEVTSSNSNSIQAGGFLDIYRSRASDRGLSSSNLISQLLKLCI